ncbi:MAG: response regulator [Clostridiales bacterium]|jgi:signal transduction histidine kinase/DNA-binding response OmpR family regulator|nr:response regulator [Clostridiales bacterium]
MKFFLRKSNSKPNKSFSKKLIFTAVAFALMVLLSYLFLGKIVRDNMVLHAEGVLDLTAEMITSALREFESTVVVFSDETREMVLSGASADELQAYLHEISRFSYLDGSRNNGLQDFCFYYEAAPGGEPVFFHGNASNIEDSYLPESQEWYKMAVNANGETVETPPIVVNANETAHIYAKSIFDRDGRRLGVCCIKVRTDFIGERIVQTALTQRGYGTLISENMQVLYHPNTDFRGLDLRNPSIPFSIFYDDISAGKNIIQQEMMTFRGEPGLGFFSRLHNGWYLGLVTVKAQYYQSLTLMWIILAALGIVLAAALGGILVNLDTARAKSDEDSKQKSMFLANMSHEIRTPINAIVGMSAIGKSAVSSERKDYCFAKIDNASKHLLGVINDILDISKIEANKIELSPADFNFEKMLQQVVNVINFRIDEKHQTLNIYIDENIPKVLYADDQRFSQVITNLLSNAVKFTPERGVISLKTHLAGEDNGIYTIQVEVADSGIGISPEQQKKLFQSFQQAESSTTRHYGGTGLGLSISKNIVELLGGEIKAESKLGEGAVFTFTVKVKLGDDTKHGISDQAVNCENVRILIVDDDRDILEYFSEIIKGFGASCDVAANAEEALLLVEKTGPYNIYFVDLKMPDIDGIELTRQIRAEEKQNGFSVIIMISSADLTLVEEEAKKSGVNKFLIKPIFPSSISDVIKECIGEINEKAAEVPPDINGIFAGRNILFAEDMEINREIVMTLLEPTQINIECAENGLQATEMFTNNPDKYDMILMDVQMPKMDGYEATRNIRALSTPRAKQIPIVAMTANVFKEDVEKCIAAGMNGHLGKPIDFNEMLQVMVRYVGRK